MYLWLQDLASELLGMFTANKMAKVFFTNSGSDANDTQVQQLMTILPFSNKYTIIHATLIKIKLEAVIIYR